MNRSIIVAVLTVTMIIMMSPAGYAFIVPHNFACDNCHGKFTASIPTYIAATNACLTCHNTMGEAAKMPIDPGSMSNYFGSAAGQPSTGSRSTHTWGAYSAAGHPYNPAAMVHNTANTAAMTDGYGTYVIPTGNVQCIVCHNAKMDTVPADSQKPFLRVDNANNALCLDCHRARNLGASAIAAGTHPVAYRAYSTVYKSNPNAYRQAPVSANPYNPTANPGNYLISGKIYCTTCHAPHNADSSSATLDNHSTAAGLYVDDPAKGLKAQLQNSKGELLRSDAIGLTPNSISLCSSCHAETRNPNHNGKGQNVQCEHCHAAHVDYTGDSSLPNLNLVRRDFSNISISSGKLPAGKKAIFNTATSLRFARADGNGICQVCHTPTPGVAIHDQTDTRREDCLACHKHENGFSAADCTSCHGQPPVTNVVGGPSGKASASYMLDENFTPHVVHAGSGYYKYACKNCHYDGTKPGYHNTGSSFNDVFIDTTGSIGDQPGLTKNVPTDYNSSARTCSNVYCHSNGNPRGGTLAFAVTPSWELGKNKIINQANECSSCHASGTSLTTNAHNKHIVSGIACAVCHAATVTNAGGIADRTKHANGVKDIVFITQPSNYQVAFDASYDSAAATCTNTCHTNGLGGSPATTPKWTDSATGQCGSCHAAVPSTSLHTMHFTDTVGPKLGTAPSVCANCHDYADGASTHANGVVNLKAGNSCAPCHPGSAPIWMLGATVTCESCHVGTASQVGAAIAPLKDLNATVGHGQYSSAALTKVKCTTCHSNSADHIGAGPTEKRLLIAGNALCDSCHTTAAGKITNDLRLDLPVHGGAVNAFSRFTSATNLVNIAAVRSDTCAGCHDTHGTSNAASIRTTINGLSVAFNGSNFIETSNDGTYYHGLCQVCHTKTKYFNRNSAPVTGHATGGCLTCHDHKGSHFAFQPAGGCNTCHGYPPVSSMTALGVSGNYSTARPEDYVGGGGAHSVAGHIPKTAIQSQAWDNCSKCHPDTSHATGGGTVVKTNVNILVDPKYKFNNATSITYTGNTCSNVSCHFKPSPNWVTGN